MAAENGPIKTGDPVADITAMIYYVAPQMIGDRPLREGDDAIIKEIGDLRTEGKLNEDQLLLLDKIGLFAATDNEEF